MQSVDVVIVGGGMVGPAVACGLQDNGLYVAVLGEAVPRPLVADAPPVLRVSVTSAASEKLLAKLDVWCEIIVQRANCYHDMEMWDKDSLDRTSFGDQSMGFSHLGRVIENTVAHRTLQQKVQCCADVTLLASAELQQVAWNENEASPSLQSGSISTARLVADVNGANSWPRNKADISLVFWDYHHHALVTMIRTAGPHRAVAHQALYGEGTLALLPLSDPHLCSIVRSLSSAETKQMQKADEAISNQALNTTSDNGLDLCQLASERGVFPLTGRCTRRFAARRLALVGDAAYTIHPLTGQGVNLGLMDTAKLIDELRRLHVQGRDIGQHLYLRRYRRSRKHNAALMLAGMQGFREMFPGGHPAKKFLRDMGLKLADLLPGVKPQLIRQAMGLNDLSAWLR